MFDYDATTFRTDLAKKAQMERKMHARMRGSEQNILASIFHAIEELKQMMAGAGSGASNPVTFTVTERDAGGKIKSFKVE